MVEPLAPYGKYSHTYLSRSLSLTLLDQNGTEIPFQTSNQHPIQLIIPRDPNLPIAPMTNHNVTAFNATPHNQSFHYHYVDITSTLPISVHIEMRPLNPALAYLFIYRFDQSPYLNQTDGWQSFCPSGESSAVATNERFHTAFIDEQQTIGHQTLVFGLRELNAVEMIDRCLNNSKNRPPMLSSQPAQFTVDYELRVYTSGCHYLDEAGEWKSDGLRVSAVSLYTEEDPFCSDPRD